MTETQPKRRPVLCLGCKACYYIPKSQEGDNCELCNSEVTLITEEQAMKLVKDAWAGGGNVW